MNSLALEIQDSSHCAEDLKAQNPLVQAALNGLLAYPILYSAGCLKDDSGNYCEHLSFRGEESQLMNVNRFCQRSNQHYYGSGCVPVLPSARHGNAWCSSPDLRHVSQEYDEHLRERCYQSKSTHQPDLFECSTASRFIVWAELGHPICQNVLIHRTSRFFPKRSNHTFLGASNHIDSFLAINDDTTILE